MLVPRTQLVGVDKPIDGLQRYVFKHVLDEFGAVNDLQYTSYSRVYRNLSAAGKVIPEAYMGNGNYSENFHDDKLDILSFFDVSEQVKFDGRFIVDVSQIYMVNLSRLNPSDDRADEVVRMKIYRIVEHGMNFGMLLKGFDHGIKRTFADYDQEVIKHTNLHPFHCFKFNFEVQYLIKNCEL